MENLFVLIGETLSLEIPEIENIEYMDKAMGCNCIVSTVGGKKYILSLIDAE